MMLEDITTGGLQPQERVILRDLLDNGFCTYARLSDQLWASNPEPPLCTRTIISIRVSGIRKHLKPGWRITAMDGQGLRLEN